MNDTRAPYLQVAGWLRDGIVSGRYAAGDKLPSVHELMETFEVAKQTVQKALIRLRDEGYVTSWQGRGTFVRSATPVGSPNGGPPDLGAEIMQRLERILDELQQLEQRVAQLEKSRRARRPGR
jgi:DNA-binding GntR family transcriptional regulator